MKRAKSGDLVAGWRWRRTARFLLVAVVLYLAFVFFKLTLFLETRTSDNGPILVVDPVAIGATTTQAVFHRRLEDTGAPPRKEDGHHESLLVLQRPQSGYGRITGEIARRKRNGLAGNASRLEMMAQEAYAIGLKAWEGLEKYQLNGDGDINPSALLEGKPESSCPSSVSMAWGKEERTEEVEKLVFLPCGMAGGSSVTVVGTPRQAHAEFVPQLARMRRGEGTVMVSQFMVELQGLKSVEGEEPPKILHLNPRIKGDWGDMPVIEHNTCYRMQWGKAMRCDGTPAQDDDETVDGFRKCEKWLRSDTTDEKESKTTSWLQRFIGRAKKPEMTWPFPFVEERLFVLTIQAGMEGYHVNIGGRHISSFPYHLGFSLEDATGLAIKGNVDIHSVYATSLPKSHSSFSLQQVLEMSEKWKPRPLPQNPVFLFIGILSATNHFAERMAIRKTWMQSPEMKSSNVVALFFVALNPRKEVNAVLKKEAAYFGDVVILPFMDRYELVVLKTIAICEYGVRNLTAAYIMKADDDTFIRLDVVLKQIEGTDPKRPLYMGNLNLFHRPLRTGKWAVTYEEWPELIYPPYANGPGYVISSDIAKYIFSQHANQSLRLFKMEDVSMGMWVEQFNATTHVQYSHNWKFCQYGCMENYFTAHYQSPRQMMCLWDKLAKGRAQCCNFR